MNRPLAALLLIAVPVFAQPRLDVLGDALPEGAIARFGTVRFRIGTVGPVALSPDGKTLAAESAQGITLWDVETGRPRLPIGVSNHHRTHDSVPEKVLAFSLDNKSLARVYGKDLRIFNATTGELRRAIELRDGGWGVFFVREPPRLVVTRSDRTTWTVDTEAGTVSESKMELPVDSLSPSGRLFLGMSDFKLHAIDAGTGRVRCRFPDTEDLSDPHYALPADDSRLYAVSPNGRLITFDARTGKKLEELDQPAAFGKETGTVRLALSPDGTVAYLSKQHKPTHRRDLKNGKWLDPLPEMPGGRLIPHPDRKRVLLVGSDGLLHRYDLATLKELPPPEGFDDYVSAAITPDGRVAAGTGDKRYYLKLFDPSGKLTQSIGLKEWVTPHFAPDGLTCFVVGSHFVSLYDTRTKQPIWSAEQKSKHVADSPPQFLPDGKHILVATGHGESIGIFDRATGRRVRSLKGGSDLSVAVSPDGRTVAFGNLCRGIRLVDFVTEKTLCDWTDPEPELDDRPYWRQGRAEFSPDGTCLLNWDENHLAIVRDPATGASLRTLDLKLRVVQTFAFSPDGQYLVVAGNNGSIGMWDFATGTQVWMRSGHTDGVHRIEFAGPGKLLSSSFDLTALLWDLRPTGKLTSPLWQALSGNDAAEAYRAIWALADDREGPGLLRSKIATVRAPTAETVRELLAGLDSTRFADRESASKKLADLGRLIEVDLRTARAKAVSEESRARIDALLAKIPRERTATERVHARAVMAMELSGSGAARELLREWAAGASAARLTIDAKGALARLAR